ncbi:hypothetical protein BDK51DRAFT_46323 [Blyttiomyces helicus]|uniref:Uncharacterized protein n=1 Tax=Blyttiomyces helicus TaxID=388810 RepID=A0A4P9WJP2_9FUNG|nr:hypothetical protein BDK51DRAFT_46323 [Blyttiomyces helicus]|eukprot:RKO92285.1 hypothetical protein BDK51DRAFT_46323 [Blyttiomyces helicus]
MLFPPIARLPFCPSPLNSFGTWVDCPNLCSRVLPARRLTPGVLSSYIGAECESLDMPLKPFIREHIDITDLEDMDPADHRFLKRVDIANAAPPNLRILYIRTNNRLVTEFLPQTLTELTIVPGLFTPCEAGFLVKLLRRLRRLQRLTLTTTALRGDAPPDEAWEGSSLATLIVTPAKHFGPLARDYYPDFIPTGLVHLAVEFDLAYEWNYQVVRATYPPTLRRPELRCGYFSKFADSILQSLPNLEVLVVSGDGPSLESQPDAAAVSGGPRTGEITALALLRTVLCFLELRKLTIGRDCAICPNVGGDGVVNLNLMDLPRLEALFVCSSIRIIPEAFPPSLVSLGLKFSDIQSTRIHSVLEVLPMRTSLRDLELIGQSLHRPPPSAPPLDAVMLPLPSLKTLTLGPCPPQNICKFISSLPALETLNLASDTRVRAQTHTRRKRHPSEKVLAPWDCINVTEEVAEALPPINKFNIRGLHSMCLACIQALRNRGTKVTMASKRQPEPLERRTLPVDLESLPTTDAEMRYWIEGDPNEEEEEDDEDGSWKNGMKEPNQTKLAHLGASAIVEAGQRGGPCVPRPSCASHAETRETASVPRARDMEMPGAAAVSRVMFWGRERDGRYPVEYLASGREVGSTRRAGLSRRATNLDHPYLLASHLLRVIVSPCNQDGNPHGPAGLSLPSSPDSSLGPAFGRHFMFLLRGWNSDDMRFCLCLRFYALLPCQRVILRSSSQLGKIEPSALPQLPL